ncbi:MAG: dihydroorotase [Rhodocyclaceae bacterium]|nr:dihydroorotase [Rhodocyclaceae bacterium]
MKIHIKNGRVIDPASNTDRVQDVFVAGSKVVALGDAPGNFLANRVIDATGLVVCPGLVDISARLREPGYEYRATLVSEMSAAVAGGVTSLACPPDTDPVLDEPGLVEMLKYRAKTMNKARVFPRGALTVGLKGEHITEMAELTEAGCVAFSQADTPIVNTEVLHHALQYAATFGFPVWLQPRDAFVGRKGVAHDGEVATRLGLTPIPVTSETIALATILQLARDTGARVHIARISSGAGLNMVRDARAHGLSVTCDVSINHLHLCDTDIGYFNPHCHLMPPLRSQSDREALRQGLADGSIDVLCSDHTPVDDDGKQVPFDEAEPGATGLELLLPLTLKWGSEMGLPLAKTLSRITADAARVLGVDHGRLVVGAAADLCLFDPEAWSRVSRENLLSQGKNTPFLGLELPGKVRYTLVDGNVVFEAKPNT